MKNLLLIYFISYISFVGFGPTLYELLDSNRFSKEISKIYNELETESEEENDTEKKGENEFYSNQLESLFILKSIKETFIQSKIYEHNFNLASRYDKIVSPPPEA